MATYINYQKEYKIADFYIYSMLLICNFTYKNTSDKNTYICVKKLLQIFLKGLAVIKKK